MNDSTVNNWDARIRHNIIASKSFLGQVDFLKISKEELNYVLESVYYVYNDKNERNKSSKYILDEWKNESLKFTENVKVWKGMSYYLFNLNAMIQIFKYKNVDKYYDYFDKILDEYKYHDKIVEGGKIL